LVKDLQTPGVFNDGKQNSYALGLQLGAYRGLPIVEHNGALFGYRNAILRFPEQRFTVICLCNLSSVPWSSLVRKVADIYLEKELQPEPGALNPSGDRGFPDPAQFAGKYLDPRQHWVYSFTVVDGSLEGWGAHLRRVGPNQFKDLGSDTITFASRDNKMTATLDMDGKTIFAGTRIEEPHPSQA
jgi:hypothetical protein